MKETSLLKIALISSLIGIILLSIITSLPLSITTLSFDKVKIKGTIKNLKIEDKKLILDITESKDTRAIISNIKNGNLTQGTNIEIIGRMNKGVLMGERIRVINNK